MLYFVGVCSLFIILLLFRAPLSKHLFCCRGEALAAALKASPGGPPSVEVFEADLASVASVQALVSTLKATLTHVDVLVNAAAATRPHPTRETSAEGVERTFATNALAPFQLMVKRNELWRMLGRMPRERESF